MIVSIGELEVLLYMIAQQHHRDFVRRGIIGLIIIDHKDRIMSPAPFDQFGKCAFQPLVAHVRISGSMHAVLIVG
jgi:hypothetical protein